MALVSAAVGRSVARPLGAGEATGLLLYRNYLAYRRAWYIFLTGFLEPVFYLFSIGVGVGQLVTGFEFNGQEIPYAEFVAPGMLATSAMNGAVLDATFNFFFKLKYNKLFDQLLATPLTTADIARGELSWSLARGGIYSAGFLVVMQVLKNTVDATFVQQVQADINTRVHARMYDVVAELQMAVASDEQLVIASDGAAVPTGSFGNAITFRVRVFASNCTTGEPSASASPWAPGT